MASRATPNVHAALTAGEAGQDLREAPAGAYRRHLPTLIRYTRCGA
jgi:hypothetical protein